MAKDEVMIEPGMEVVTVDLMKNPKLNGMRGRVIGFEKPPNSGQLAVVVHFGKEAMMMFHHNLQAVPNSKIEMRIDEADGALYTLDEFKEFYAEEGIKKWKVSKTFEMKEPLYSAPYTGPAPKPKPKGKAAKPKPKGKAEKPKPKGKAAKPKPKGKKARAAAAAAAEEEDEPEESEPPSPPPRSPRSPKPKPKPKGKKAAAKAAAKAAPKPKPKAKAAKPAPKAAKKKKEPEPEPEPEVEEEEPEVEPEEEEAPQPEEEPEVEEEPEPEAEPEAEAEPEEAPPEAEEEEAAAEPEEPEEAEPEAEPEPERAATPDPPQEEDEKEADKEAPTPPQEPPSPAPSSPQGGGGGGEGDDGEDAAAASTSKRSEGEGAPDANDAAEAEAAAAAAAAAGEDVASNKADTASPRAGGDGGDDARSVASKASKGGGDDAKSMEASGRSQDTAAARSQVSEGGAPITKTDKLKETPSGGSGLARTASQASADPSLKKSASVVSVAASKASEKSAAVSKPASVASLSRKDSAASAATHRTAASSSAKPVKERSPSLVSSSGHSSVAGGGASPDTATLPQPKHSADAAAAELFNDSLTSFRTGGGGSIPSLPSAFKPDPNPAQQLPPSTAAAPAPAPAPAAAAVPEAAPGHKLADPLVRRAYLTQHLERFYQKHHPAKAPQAWAIGGRAINREDDLYKKLAIRYPTAISDLSFILTAVDANAAYLGSKERSGKRARRLSKKSVTAPDSILSDEGSQASLDSDRSASSSSAGGFSSSDDGGVASGGGGAATKVVHRPGRPKIELDLSKYRQRYSSNPFNNAKRTEAEVVAANEAAAKEARSGFSGDAGAASNPRSASSSMPYRSSRGIGVSFDLPMHHFEQPAEQRAAPAARRTSERREGRSASGRSSGSGAHHRQQQPPLPSEPPPLHILQQSFESNLSPPHARPPPPPPPSVPHAVYSPQPSRGVTQPSGPSRAVPAYIDHAPMGGMTSEEEELDELIAQVEAEEAGMRKIAEAARASTAASQAAVRRAARTSPPKRGAHAHPGSRPAAVAAPERRLPQPPSHPPPQRFEVPEPQQKRHGAATVTAALQSVSQQAPYPHGDAYASHGDGGEDDELSDLERQIAREEAYIQSLTAKKTLLKQQRGAAWPQQQQQQRASPARGLAPPPLAPSLTASPLPPPPPPAALHAERQLPTTPGGAFDAAVDSFLQTVDEEEDMGQPPSEAAPQMASSGGAPVAYTSSYSTEVAQIAQLNTMIHQMVQQQAVLEEQVGLAAATTPGAHPQLQSAGLSPLHAAAPAPAPLLADAALPYAHKKALAVAATPPPPPPPAAALVATPAAASVSHTVQRLRYESDFLARQQLDMLAAQRAELDRLETYASPAPNTH